MQCLVDAHVVTLDLLLWLGWGKQVKGDSDEYNDDAALKENPK